jgi:hypothetical protein
MNADVYKKKCNTCGQTRPASMFSAHKTTADRLRTYCKPCSVASVKRWQQKNPDWRLQYSLQRFYKMSLDTYRRLWRDQLGACAICGGNFSQDKTDGRQACVDHDHACCPGRFTCGDCTRGLICFNCNTVLGKVKDNPDILRSAIRYLEGGDA